MGEAAEKLIECPLEYALTGAGDTVGGSAVGRVDAESLAIMPKMGEPLLFSLREILELSEGDYAINILLASKEKLALTKLGVRFEDFSRILSRARNDAVLKDMLLRESLVLGGLKGACEFNGKHGNCELRIYEASLVAVVERGEPLRFPFGGIAGIAEGDYSLVLTMESGDKLAVSGMGSRDGPFKKALGDAMSRLSLQAQEQIKTFAPGVGSPELRRAARLLRDGRAAKKADLDAISPELWRGLEKKMREIGILEEYEFVSSLAQKERLCAGLKRGSMGEFSGDMIWVLAPVPESNAVILEAASAGPGEAVKPLPSAAAAEGTAPAGEPKAEEAGAAGGRWATYVFSIVPRSQFPAPDMGARTDAFLKSLNDGLVSIDFRREPVFMPDADLEMPENARYWHAVRRLPMLGELRRRFAGRAVHATREQWRKAVKDILRFNAESKDDGAKYGD